MNNRLHQHSERAPPANRRNIQPEVSTTQAISTFLALSQSVHGFRRRLPRAAWSHLTSQSDHASVFIQTGHRTKRRDFGNVQFHPRAFGELTQHFRHDGRSVVLDLKCGRDCTHGCENSRTTVCCKHSNGRRLVSGLGKCGTVVCFRHSDDAYAGRSIHFPLCADSRAASITACEAAPSWKLGTHARPARIASTNSNAWS